MTVRPWTARVLLLSALLGSLTAPPVRAQGSGDEAADPLELARLHFKLGVDFYREHDFRAAQIEFQRAYEAAPHYKLLYNLGQVSLELQEGSSGIAYFRRYLSEGGGEISAERRSEVEQSIEHLRARLATITVTSDQTAAEIYVDDLRVGTAPLSEPIQVSVGRRKLVAVKAGFADAERVIDVASGDQLQVALNFAQRAQLDPSRLRVAVVQPVAAASGPSPALWTGVGTGVVAAGAITLSVLTYLAQNDYDDERRVPTTRADIQRLRDDTERKAIIADILWGATVFGAGATAVLLLISSDDERERAPALHVRPSSVGVRAEF